VKGERFTSVCAHGQRTPCPARIIRCWEGCSASTRSSASSAVATSFSVILGGERKGREVLTIPSSLRWVRYWSNASPFTQAEVETLTRWAESLKFDVIYDPYTHRESELETLARANPEERARFIAQYCLNISPATDDIPFFFHFYRWGNLLRLNLKGSCDVRPSLAVLILLGALAQITILSVILILYPLYRRKTTPLLPGGRTSIFIYFASLGLGFILVEIALLQKLTVFLGGPAYSMSITLFTILLTSGIGSFLSRNWSGRSFRLLAIVIPLLFVAIIAESLLLDRAIASLMNLSHLLRCLSAVMLVAPLGLLMGIPFPTGLRQVDQTRPELNPWAWGINACATVMGTIVCILISNLLGFRIALILAAVIYLMGWLIFMTSQRHIGSEPLT